MFHQALGLARRVREVQVGTLPSLMVLCAYELYGIHQQCALSQLSFIVCIAQ